MELDGVPVLVVQVRNQSQITVMAGDRLFNFQRGRFAHWGAIHGFSLDPNEEEWPEKEWGPGPRPMLVVDIIACEAWADYVNSLGPEPRPRWLVTP